MIDMERENLQERAAETEEKLHVLACARQQQSVAEEKEELDLLREKIKAARQQELIWNRNERHLVLHSEIFLKNIFLKIKNSRIFSLNIFKNRNTGRRRKSQS